jgi:tetratricopeptide (TPR) repeat protein
VRRVATVLGAALALTTAAGSAAALSSADELVRQARAHEAAHEEDIAARRYTEALTLDPAQPDAWLGLGGLRERLGELAEAERVYSAALERVPTLHRALEARAVLRWKLGRHVDAEADELTYAETEGDPRAFRQLAEWFGSEGRTPAQLAIWRRLLAMASRASDGEGLVEAERMVRALVILVDSADPASSPVEPDATRSALARIARRGR